MRPCPRWPKSQPSSYVNQWLRHASTIPYRSGSWVQLGYHVTLCRITLRALDSIREHSVWFHPTWRSRWLRNYVVVCRPELLRVTSNTWQITARIGRFFLFFLCSSRCCLWYLLLLISYNRFLFLFPCKIPTCFSTDTLTMKAQCVIWWPDSIYL